MSAGKINPEIISRYFSEHSGKPTRRIDLVGYLQRNNISCTGVSVGLYVSRHRKEYGWPAFMSSGESTRVTVKRRDSARDEKFRSARRRGTPIKDAAASAGLSERSGQRLNSKFIGEGTLRRTRAERSDTTAARVYHQQIIDLWRQGISTRDIADTVGYTRRHVQAIISDYKNGLDPTRMVKRGKKVKNKLN